jgi:hypothetical protein
MIRSVSVRLFSLSISFISCRDKKEKKCSRRKAAELSVSRSPIPIPREKKRKSYPLLSSFASSHVLRSSPNNRFSSGNELFPPKKCRRSQHHRTEPRSRPALLSTKKNQRKEQEIRRNKTESDWKRGVVLFSLVWL